MPRNGRTYLLLLLFCLMTPLSQASDLLSLAHKAGFDRCDSAIATEFQDLSTNGNGVASTGYFNDRSFNVMATWGKDRDSVWKNTTFIKFGRNCLAYSVISTTFPAGCVVFKEKNPQWSVIKEQGDFTWTRNKGGVNAIMKSLPNGACEVTYRVHQTYQASASKVNKSQKQSAQKKPEPTKKPKKNDS